jgi:hypothetical protein
LRSAEHILPTLAEALSFRFQGGDKRTPKQQVFDFLCHRHMLLVMDNVEHLLGRPPSIPPRGAFKGRFLVRVKNAARQVSCYNRLESKPAK